MAKENTPAAPAANPAPVAPAKPPDPAPATTSGGVGADEKLTASESASTPISPLGSGDAVTSAHPLPAAPPPLADLGQPKSPAKAPGVASGTSRPAHLSFAEGVLQRLKVRGAILLKSNDEHVARGVHCNAIASQTTSARDVALPASK
jgi:hypothetical protein